MDLGEFMCDESFAIYNHIQVYIHTCMHTYIHYTLHTYCQIGILPHFGRINMHTYVVVVTGFLMS